MFAVEDLRLLVAVADAGSFTQAAAAHNYTQSAVSRRIAALESQAGGPLFERLPRGVRLNPAGTLLYRHATDILDRMSRAHDDLVALNDGRGGPLRVGAFATANIVLLPTALRAFTHAWPRIEVDVHEARSAVSMRRLADGALDIVIVSDYPSGLPSVEGVTTTVLLRDEVQVVLHREHRLAQTDTIDLRDLRDEVWLQNAKVDSPTMMADAWTRAGFQPRRVIRVAEWAGKFGYVAAGLGVALVPRLAVRAIPADLVVRRIGNQPPHRTVHVATPAVPLPAALRLLQRLRASPVDMLDDDIRPDH